MTQFICIGCPVGCELTVTAGPDPEVTGNACPIGARYGKEEVTHPTRMVTSSVRVGEFQMLSVKTERPIPKNKIWDCVAAIKEARPTLPVAVGDVILRDVAGTGVNVVATREASGCVT
jgi:CxxC motif-containing protein